MAHRAWIIPVLLIGVLTVLLMTDWIIPSGKERLFVLQLDASDDCRQLESHVGVKTNRFELLGTSWMEDSDASGICVIDVKLGGFGAPQQKSTSHFYRFLRDEVDISGAVLTKAFFLDKH